MHLLDDGDGRHLPTYWHPLAEVGRLPQKQYARRRKSQSLRRKVVIRSRKTEPGCCCMQIQRIIKACVMMKFQERRIWLISASLGMLIITMQVAPIFLPYWINVTEPRTVGVKNNKGDNVEAYYNYNIGLLWACRYIKQPLNLTELDISASTAVALLKNDKTVCVWNPAYNPSAGSDLSDSFAADFSFAAIAILVRLVVPTALHIVGVVFTILAWIYSLTGYFKKNNGALYSAILYILGGLGIVIGVLQLICVVDDEMHPRMKRDSSGEESKYNFTYGISWMSAAFSFLPVQLCVYLQTTVFFNRFSTPMDKARVVPGIENLLNQMTVVRSRIHQLGRPAPLGGWSRGDGVSVNFVERSRRESRASKDFSSIPFTICNDFMFSGAGPR